MDQLNGQPHALLNWMDSLADPTRLRLLRLLERQELGVVDLCEVLQMPQSTVSRHLKLLSDQHWTASRRRGTTNLYRMSGDELDPVAQRLWQLAREQTESWAEIQQDQLRLKQRLASRPGDTQAFFAGAAGRWDKLRRELYGDGFANDALLALLPAEWTVADLGCGTGQMLVQLAGRVRRVIGVDNSSAMLDAAAERTRDLSNIALRQGDLEALPIDDASCDAALLVLVLTYVEDPALVLAELARILRPGGKAVVVDLLRHDRDDFRRDLGQRWLGFECDVLTSLMADANLASPTCRPLPPQPEAKGPALLLATAAISSA